MVLRQPILPMRKKLKCYICEKANVGVPVTCSIMYSLLPHSSFPFIGNILIKYFQGIAEMLST